MSHWAEIDENNIVIRVTVGDNNESDEGYQWLIDNLGGTWIKTSYNAYEGKKRNAITNEITNEPGFRKNFAGIGMYYDEQRDAFISPKPYNSFILNEEKCIWEPPIQKPDDEKLYIWDEETISWKEIIPNLAETSLVGLPKEI